MKRLFLLLTCILIFCSVNVKAQLTLEHTYVYPKPPMHDIFLTNIGHSNYKYVLWDTYNCKLNLYNIDHTPFQVNINVPMCDSAIYYRIGFITNTMFDCDSATVEYAMMGYSSDPTKKFYVFRTDGTILFSRDSVTVPYCYGCGVGSFEIRPVTNTPAGTKLRLFKEENGMMHQSVYSLCDSLPSEVKEPEFLYSPIKVFPNPSSNEIHFEIIPFSNLEEFTLEIMNTSSQVIKIFKTSGTKILYLNTASLPSGIYLYSLRNKERTMVSAGKFIINK